MSKRGLGAVREGFSLPSGKILVFINLALAGGVLLFDWSVFDVVFLYWAENLVIGVINVLKMITASPAPQAAAGARSTDAGEGAKRKRKDGGWVAKLFLIPFFIIHYGGFCFGHGIFVLALFNESGKLGDDPWSALPALITGGLAISLALLAASHLFSFVTNYLMGGEYRRTTAQELMGRPYGRIVALHVTIIIGGFLVMAFGDQRLMLVVLVVLKTFVDLAMHGRERQKYIGENTAPIMGQTPEDAPPAHHADDPEPPQRRKP